MVNVAYWRRENFVRQYSHQLKVRCASPIFKPIAYKLRFTNRKRKYFEEKTTATLKSKQTSIATVRNHLRTLASFPTPLIFHWSLPLRMQKLNFLKIFFLITCQQAHHLQTKKLIFFLLKFCAKILFCRQYFSPLNTLMRKGKDPDPYH